MTTIPQLLPPELLLGPHLSAYRYFFVCTLTVAAWDSLVLSARTWRLYKTDGWPLLKILVLTLRYLMPIEFIVLAVSVFSTTWSPSMCSKSYLLEPILSAILLSLTSLTLIIRVSALYAHNRSITYPLYSLLAAQIAVHAVCCAYYAPLQLKPGQGCIAAPKYEWGGVYWVVPTVLYGVLFALATSRSLSSNHPSHSPSNPNPSQTPEKPTRQPLSLWKLTTRDALNLYLVIFLVNLINLLYVLLIRPSSTSRAKETPGDDPIKLIVSTMSTVLSCTMGMRVVLLASVRGGLWGGGVWAGSSGAGGTGGAGASSGSVSKERTGAGAGGGTAGSGPMVIRGEAGRKSGNGAGFGGNGNGNVGPTIVYGGGKNVHANSPNHNHNHNHNHNGMSTPPNGGSMPTFAIGGDPDFDAKNKLPGGVGVGGVGVGVGEGGEMVTTVTRDDMYDHDGYDGYDDDEDDGEDGEEDEGYVEDGMGGMGMGRQRRKEVWEA